jgi:hypothetical protein
LYASWGFWDNGRVRVVYARVSRQDQRLKPQYHALLTDGYERIFEEKVSSKEDDPHHPHPRRRRYAKLCRSRTSSRGPFSIRLLTCLYPMVSAALPNFLPFRYLQVIGKWRDPDSNRGYHGFQLCGLRLRLLLVALQSVFLSQIAPRGVVGWSPVVVTSWCVRVGVVGGPKNCLLSDCKGRVLRRRKAAERSDEPKSNLSP